MPRHVNDRWRDFLGPGALPSFLVASATAILGLGLPIIWRLRQVLAAARLDEREPSDVILVLGRALRGDELTAVFRARLDHGVELFRAGLAPRIVVTGGLTGRSTRTEAAVGEAYLRSQGVPADVVLTEDRSRHTLENLTHVRETLQTMGWRRLLIVSDPLHLARVGALARGLGLDHRFSPARAAAPRARWAWWARATREAFFVHWYHAGVAYSRLIGNQRYLERVT